jgi:hypothetical protein
VTDRAREGEALALTMRRRSHTSRPSGRVLRCVDDHHVEVEGQGTLFESATFDAGDMGDALGQSMDRSAAHGRTARGRLRGGDGTRDG